MERGREGGKDGQKGRRGGSKGISGGVRATLGPIYLNYGNAMQLTDHGGVHIQSCRTLFLRPS